MGRWHLKAPLPRKLVPEYVEVVVGPNLFELASNLFGEAFRGEEQMFDLASHANIAP